MKVSHKVLEMEPKLVDFKKIIRSQKNKILRNLPGFIIRFLKRVIHENDINTIISNNIDKYGTVFVKGALDDLNININVSNKENIPVTGRYIFVCNHPLGAIDFLSAFIVISEKQPETKVIANEVLSWLDNLKELFIPVNVFGRSSLKTGKEIEKILVSENMQLMSFPAGTVSRKTRGVIEDTEWNKSFIKFALEHKRNVIPIHIESENTKRFYRVSNIRNFFGIKTNLELFLLPGEIFRKRNSIINIAIGECIPFKTFSNEKSHFDWAQYVRSKVYKIEHTQKD